MSRFNALRPPGAVRPKVPAVEVRPATATVKVPQPTEVAIPQVTSLQSSWIDSLLIFLYLVTLYSRLPEFLAFMTSTRIPIVMVISVLALARVLVSGGLTRAMGSRVGLLLLIYTGWLFLLIPLSTWRGESFEVVTQDWLRSLCVFVIIATLIKSMNDVRKVFFLLVISVWVIAAFSILLGSSVEGRFAFQTGTLGNSNDLAIHLLNVLPICAYFSFDRTSSKFCRLVSFFAALWILFIVAKTGSRTGLLALGAILIVAFICNSMANRVKLSVMALALVMLAVMVTPREVLIRYVLMFTSMQTDSADELAINSSEGSTRVRMELFWAGVNLVKEHPIFGVGPGNYYSSASSSTAVNGNRFWKQTHNIYLQIAAETGIPGLLLYVSILTTSLLWILKVRRLAAASPNEYSVRHMATALLAALVAYVVSSFFATNAYWIYTPLYAALSYALYQHASVELSVPPGHAIR